MNRHAALQIVLLAALAAGFGCKPHKEAAPAGKPGGQPPVAVRLVAAIERNVPVEIPAFGTVQPRATAVVKAQVGGLLQKVLFTEGQEVRAGDPLFTIDPRPFDAALAAAEARIEQARTEGRNATKELERLKDLATRGIAAQETLDTASTRSEAAAAALRVAEAVRDSAKIEREYCDIRAPISGVAGTLQVKPGNLLKAGEAALVTINQIAPVDVHFTVPQDRLATIRGRLAQSPAPVVRTIASGSETAATGTLTLVDNAVDTATGTIALQAAFPNEDRVLWPGAFVRVALVLGETLHAVIVPASAVQKSQQGDMVYAVGADMLATPRTVQVDRRLGDEVVLASGLAAGERIVAEGQFRLSPGAKVVEAGAAKGEGRKP